MISPNSGNIWSFSLELVIYYILGNRDKCDTFGLFAFVLILSLSFDGVAAAADLEPRHDLINQRLLVREEAIEKIVEPDGGEESIEPFEGKQVLEPLVLSLIHI